MISLNQKPTSQPQKKQVKKSDTEGEIRSQTKELLMEFSTYTKAEIVCILELCEFEFKVARAYLKTTPKAKVRKVIKDFLAGKVLSLEAAGFSAKQISPTKEETKAAEEKEVEEFVPTGPNLLDLMMRDELVHYILDFLDPVSLGKVHFLCKRFYKIGQHPLLFKKFCKKLYHQHPPLPKDSPFNALLLRINTAPRGEFDPKFIAQANKNIRSVVWLPDLKTYQTPNNFYKNFKDMRDIYMNAPRLRFGGIYMLKEKYIRVGSKDLTGFYDPYHTIEFYRYFRFFPDGVVMSSLAVNRLKTEKLCKIFKLDTFNEDEENENFNPSSGVKSVLHGEYILEKNLVHIRLNAKTTLYEYTLVVGGSAPGLFDQLRMTDQTLRLVGNDFSEPLQNDYMGNKTFKFVKVKEMMEEFDDSVRSYAT